MTRPAFLDALAWSLILLRPEVLTATPPLYPRGALIRLKVRAPWDTRVPPLLDPAGLVWFAQTRRFRGVNQAYVVLTAGLGMTPVDALNCIEASDWGPERLTPEQRAWRGAILDVVEAYRTDVLSPQNANSLTPHP